MHMPFKIDSKLRFASIFDLDFNFLFVRIDLKLGFESFWTQMSDSCKDLVAIFMKTCKVVGLHPWDLQILDAHQWLTIKICRIWFSEIRSLTGKP